MSCYNPNDFVYEITREDIKGLTIEDIEILKSKAYRFSDDYGAGTIAAKLARIACDLLRERMIDVHQQRIDELYDRIDRNSAECI